MSDDNDDSLHRRGILGIVGLAVPVISIFFVALAYAITWWIAAQGRAAEGPLQAITFAGCPEALPLVQARAELMGLPELAVAPAPGGFTLTGRLPSDERAAGHIPATLAATGRLQVRPITAGQDGSEVLADNSDVLDVVPYIDFLDTPKVAVQLSPLVAERIKQHMGAHPEDSLGYWLDDRRVTTRRNAPPEALGKLLLDLGQASDLERIEFTAAAGVILAHAPLPCPVTVVGVEDRSPPLAPEAAPPG